MGNLLILILGFVCGLLVAGGPIILLMYDIVEEEREKQQKQRKQKIFEGQEWD